MKGRKKAGIRILAMLLVLALTLSLNGIDSVYASESVTYSAPEETLETEPDTQTFYAVNLSEVEHGEISASTDRAAEGEEVLITVTPEEGYQVGDFSITMEDGTEVTYTFEEPQESDQDKGMQYFFQMK